MCWECRPKPPYKYFPLFIWILESLEQPGITHPFALALGKEMSVCDVLKSFFGEN